MKVSGFYITTLTLLVTHQIDAAFWREWEMFGISGGIQFFDVFNLAILPILLIGLRSVLLSRRSGYFYSIFLSCLGILTFLIHCGFFLLGFGQFALPVSLALIFGCGVAGAIQLFFTVRNRRNFINV